MEDKDLEKVTKMLERGGTMLAKHCECGAPLFKYQGKVVCPVCDAKKQEQARVQQQAQERHAEEQSRLAVPVETKPALSSRAVEPVRSTPVMEMPERRMSVVLGREDLDEAAVEAAVIAKVNDIAARLATETYPNKIQMYLDILERSLRVLKELHGISK